MNKTTAQHLVRALSADIGDSGEFGLTDRIQKLPLNGFHAFANGKPCIGAFKVHRIAGGTLWLLVIDWRADGNFYVVVYPENNNLAPLAELHDAREAQDSIDLVWSYSPKKRDGRNEERKQAFQSAVGDSKFVVSLPSASVTLEDFLTDLFALAAFRLAADGLVVPPIAFVREGFPEGRRIERMHKSRERNSQVVPNAKILHAQKNEGSLPCEVCRFDFAERYDGLGNGYIEAHHTRPLSELETDEVCDTRVEDLALVCANCHRMLHRTRPWVSIEMLRALLEK
ncbi:HNH endonuclease [Aliiglaciecola lipolytica]|uniref:HNH endonuclease n=1 Tax=Aliiglaciecola lipolytica TaxID=477689 RepID=UPI001C08DF79|nr:HNH endonuclease [Aliiglaciecola lipolytica]MBU2876452.1 HNH endonuclease [Aliiglaciecola lipolytica]